MDRVRSVEVRPEFVLDETPAPQRLAPQAVALTVESRDLDIQDSSGRFVLLHDPDGVPEWEGNFRAVVFVRSAIESDLIGDSMIQEVSWSWLKEALDDVGAQYLQLGGTVTCNTGQSFGSMSDRPSEGFVEIRASWTPTSRDDNPVSHLMDRHVMAWLDLMVNAAGLLPIPRGIETVGSGKNRS